MIAKNASAAPLTTSANGSAAVVELERASRLADALRQRQRTDEDDDEQSRELDARHRDVELHGLADAAEVDVREPEDEQRHEHDQRHGRELLEVARERAARRGHRGQRRAHHGEADEERHEAAIERVLRVQRRAGRARILADELEVRSGREHRDDERAAEREPRRAADAPCHVARQRVDARAEHVADHEEQQQLRADDPVEPRPADRGRIRHRRRHRGTLAKSPARRDGRGIYSLASSGEDTR